MGPTPPVVEARCLSHETTREVPVSLCLTDVKAGAQRLRELTKVTQPWVWLRRDSHPGYSTPALLPSSPHCSALSLEVRTRILCPSPPGGQKVTGTGFGKSMGARRVGLEAGGVLGQSPPRPRLSDPGATRLSVLSLSFLNPGIQTGTRGKGEL